MRYALFTDKQEADGFAKEIESLCAVIPGPKIIKYAVWIEHLQRFAVGMEVEPGLLPDEVVDSVERPVESEMDPAFGRPDENVVG